jgi:hypothetical protein
MTIMKKILLAIFLFAGALTVTNAQEIGVRFGQFSGNNVAVDGVFSTGKFNRIHADVSFGGNGVGIDAIWDFLYRPIEGEAFNWYVGAGVSTFLGDPFMLGVVGEAGIEYRFNKVPIALGLDWRPNFIIVENTDFDFGGFGLNVRWVFGK